MCFVYPLCVIHHINSAAPKEVLTLNEIKVGIQTEDENEYRGRKKTVNLD